MLSKINTNLAVKLRDREYRHRFFRGRAQDDIAYQLREAREKRKLSQAQLAERCGMKQSAISRLEQASYSRWSFNTLMRVADALDLRSRIKFDYAEDVISEYQQRENPVPQHFYSVKQYTAATRSGVWTITSAVPNINQTPLCVLTSVSTRGGAHAQENR